MYIQPQMNQCFYYTIIFNKLYIIITLDMCGYYGKQFGLNLLRFNEIINYVNKNFV